MTDRDSIRPAPPITAPFLLRLALAMSRSLLGAVVLSAFLMAWFRIGADWYVINALIFLSFAYWAASAAYKVMTRHLIRRTAAIIATVSFIILLVAVDITRVPVDLSGAMRRVFGFSPFYVLYDLAWYAGLDAP